MGFKITTEDYIEYIKNAYEIIYVNGEYVTDLDLATGDGDHWSNLNMGFKKLVEVSDMWKNLSISELFKEIGKTMMSVIGGSSGVLYGSAYLAASKAALGKEYLDRETLLVCLSVMLDAIMARGQAKPGFKTMVDSLYPAIEEYKICIGEGADDISLCERVSHAAESGAESTKNMEAVKGRATYQANKGIGHLDPGAVTMSYQIISLMDMVKQRINDGK